MIVCAFPGTGKTYCEQNVRNQHTFIDLDPEPFHWMQDESGKRVVSNLWPDNYVREIIKQHDAYGFQSRVFCSTHKEVLDYLCIMRQDHMVVFPFPSEAQKEAYLKRYRDRGSSDEFVAQMGVLFMDFIHQLEDRAKSNDPAIRSTEKYLFLTPGRYLSDMFDYGEGMTMAAMLDSPPAVPPGGSAGAS